MQPEQGKLHLKAPTLQPVRTAFGLLPAGSFARGGNLGQTGRTRSFDLHATEPKL